MKLFKKVLSVAAALALVVTAVPANVKAATDVLDFEDGNTTGIFANLQSDGVTIDGDAFLMSVVDYNGSKALFIDVQDVANVPKVAFDVCAFVGASNIDKIATIEFDLTLVNPTGEAAGWNGGSFGANIGADGSQWYDPADWTVEEYEKDTTATTKMSDTFVTGMGFTKDAAGSKYLFMKWANANDMYIDNVKFLDADGNALAIQTAAVEEAAATVETATEATTTADVPKTGTTSYALYFLAAAAVMGTGVVVMKRRKSIED